MPIVLMPDGHRVNMPDNPTPDQLDALSQIHDQLLQNQVDTMQQQADAAANAGRPSDVMPVRSTTTPQLDSLKGQLRASQSTTARNEADQGGLLDKAEYWGKQLGSAAVRGALAPLALGYKAVSLLPGNGDNFRIGGVSPDDMQRSISQFGLEPQTTAEKYATSATEGLAGALVGPPSWGAAVSGVTSGLGAQAADQLTGGVNNPLARIAGGLVGGSIPTVYQALTPNAEKLISKAMRYVPREDAADAPRLKNILNENGIDYLNSQLFGNKSTLPDLVATAARHPDARPKLVAATENIPEQAKGAVGQWIENNLPPLNGSSIDVLDQVQNQADDHIKSLYNQSNQIYKRLMPNADAPMDQGVTQGILDKLKNTADDPEYFGRLSAGEGFLDKVANKINDANAPKNIGPYSLRDRMRAVVNPQATPDHADATLGSRLWSVFSPQDRYRQDPVTLLEMNNMVKDMNTLAEQEGYKGLAPAIAKTILKDATPQFDAARAAKADFIATRVNPVQKGLVGQLAQAGGGPQADRLTARDSMLNLVFPDTRSQPQAIGELTTNLGGDATGKLTAAYMNRASNQVFKDTPGLGLHQPFDYIAQIAGNDAKRANLTQAISDYNPAAMQSFNDMADALRTTKHLNIPGGIDTSQVLEQAGSNPLNYLANAFYTTRRYITDKTSKKAMTQIADIMTAPDGIQQIMQIAASPMDTPLRPYAQAVIASMQNQSQPQPNGESSNAVQR